MAVTCSSKFRPSGLRHRHSQWSTSRVHPSSLASSASVRSSTWRYLSKVWASVQVALRARRAARSSQSGLDISVLPPEPSQEFHEAVPVPFHRAAEVFLRQRRQVHGLGQGVGGALTLEDEPEGGPVLFLNSLFESSHGESRLHDDLQAFIRSPRAKFDYAPEFPFSALPGFLGAVH